MGNTRASSIPCSSNSSSIFIQVEVEAGDSANLLTAGEGRCDVIHRAVTARVLVPVPFPLDDLEELLGHRFVSELPNHEAEHESPFGTIGRPLFRDGCRQMAGRVEPAARMPATPQFGRWVLGAYYP